MLGPIQGWLLERFKVQNILPAGVVLLAVGFLLLSQIQSLLTFYLVFGLTALGASLMGILSLMTVIVNWFEKKRAMALALMQTGMSLGGLGSAVSGLGALNLWLALCSIRFGNLPAAVSFAAHAVHAGQTRSGWLST